MALLSVAMDFGNGLRVTDGFGGCISFAVATIGTDADFRGPKASIMFRAKYIGGSNGACMVAVAGRFWLEVAKSGSNFVVSLKINSTGCGPVTVDSYTFASDGVEHSYAAAMNTANSYSIWVDAVKVKTGSMTCTDISDPATAGDRFEIWGSTVLGTELFYVDEVYFAAGYMSTAQVLDLHTNGLP
jgi:hypothetical protein